MYMSVPYAIRCYSCTSFILLQLCKLYTVTVAQALYCYSCASFILLQLHKLYTVTVAQALYCYSCASLMAAPCAEWYIALQPCSMLFSGFLHSVAFLPQAFRSQSIGFRRSRHAPSPTLPCTSAMRSHQLFSIRIIRRFTLGSLHLHKCWTTLCWCTKYPSKDNLPLPLLARKRDNTQSDGRQSQHIMPFLHIRISCAREACLMCYAYA